MAGRVVPAGVLIDLDRSPVAPGRAPVRRSRVWRTATVALVCATVLTGVEAPAAAGFTPVATIAAPETDALLLTESSLFVADRSAGTYRLTAHALPDGALRWRVALANPVRAVRWVADARVLVATIYGGDADSDGVFVFDSDTGRRLWSLSGAVPVDTPPGGRMLLQRETLLGSVDLRWVDDHTGRPVWIAPISPSADVAAAHDPTRPGPGTLLVTDPDGQARLLAEDSGAPLVTGQVGSLVGNLVLTPGPVGGPQILVQQRRNGATRSLTAFDLGTLTRRWSVTGSALGPPFLCATLLCLGAAEGLRAVDPVSGAIRWRAPRWQYASMLGSHTLLAYAVGTDHDGLAVLDARTGQALRDLRSEWSWVIPDGPRSPILGRADAGLPDRYHFARLDVEPVGLRALGFLDRVDPASCQLAANLLACRSRRGQVQVWRY